MADFAEQGQPGRLPVDDRGSLSPGHVDQFISDNFHTISVEGQTSPYSKEIGVMMMGLFSQAARPSHNITGVLESIPPLAVDRAKIIISLSGVDKTGPLIKIRKQADEILAFEPGARSNEVS